SVGDDPDVFAYLRKPGDETVFVLLNMSARERTLSFKPEEFLGSSASQLTPLYSSTPIATSISLTRIVLPPFAALVGKVQ
ncbi:MAG: alpha-glucosidase C-terminal domain-containing protein, partial [Terracidiphilus sp.]